MRKLWTNYAEVLQFAKSHSRALDESILIQRVFGGWILPDYVADWNGFHQKYDDQDDGYDSIVDDFYTNLSDGNTGLSSTCDESLMDGYQQFSGEISDDGPEDSENAYRDE